jgi:hypothetical protein
VYAGESKFQFSTELVSHQFDETTTYEIKSSDDWNTRVSAVPVGRVPIPASQTLGVIIKLVFGSTSEDLNWNARADINNDNIVDIYDAIISEPITISTIHNPFSLRLICLARARGSSDDLEHVLALHTGYLGFLQLQDRRDLEDPRESCGDESNSDVRLRLIEPYAEERT